MRATQQTGDEANGLLQYSERQVMSQVIQNVMKARWVELKRLQADPGQGDRWNELPMDPEVTSAVDMFVQGDNVMKVLMRPKNLSLCHGDCRIENFLWQKNAGGALGDVYWLDWQVLAEGSPAYDLAYFLTGSFSETQTAEFGERLLKAYHETLTTAPTTKVTEGEYSYDAFMRDLQLELFPSS